MAWGSSPPTCDPTGSLAEDVFLLEPRGHTKENSAKVRQKNPWIFLPGVFLKKKVFNPETVGVLLFFFVCVFFLSKKILMEHACKILWQKRACL